MNSSLNIQPVINSTARNYRYKPIERTIIYSVLLIFMFSSCKERLSYSPPIKKAIELFYIENQNDSILQLLSSDLYLNDRNTVLKEIFTAAALCEKGDVDSASILFADIKIDEKDKILSYWHKHIGGLILFRENKPVEAYKILEEVVSGACYDIRAYALSERIIARILFTYGSNKEKGIEWMAKSSQHFQQAGLEKSIGVNEKFLGRFHMNIGNHKEALYYFEKSESVLKKFDDIAELYYIYINLNDYYVKTNNLEKAVEYADICMNILKDWDDNQMKAVLYNILGEIKLKQNKTEEAENYFQTVLNLPINFTGARAEKGIARVSLSKIYQERGQQTQAIEYALSAQRLFTGVSGYFQSKHNVYSQLAMLYSESSNKNLYNSYKDSVDFYYDSLQDERANLSKSIYDVETELLQMSYNVEQLKSNETNQRIIIIIVVTALVGLIIMLVLHYRRWKSKNMLLKSLAQKNIQLVEEERRKLKEMQQHAARSTFRKQIDENRIQLLYDQIIEWLQENDNYKLKDLTIDLLANELNTNREYVSQAINANGVKFNELINRFRVNEAVNILSNSANKLFSQKMSVIASEVGYKSESVFFGAFKKQTGMTPAQFRATEKDSVNFISKN